MSALDPYSLIRETALEIRRRQRREIALAALPPAVAGFVLLALGRLPVELLAAGLIVFGIVVLYSATLPVAERETASLIDRTLEAKDSFLTLATCGADASEPLRPLVEAGAGELAARVEPRRFLPARNRKRIAKNVLSSALGLLVLAMVPDHFRAAGPGEARLAAIADEIEASPDPEDRRLARDLRELARALQDAALTSNEKRAKVEEVLARLKDEKDGNLPGRQGQSEKSSSGGGAQGEAKGERGSGGQNQQGQGLRAQARSELEKMAQALGGSSESPDSSQAKEQSSKPAEQKRNDSGGGLQGPQKPRGAGERKDSGQGNQPANQKGEARRDDRLSGQGRKGQAGADEPGKEQVPKPSEGSQEGSSSKRPSADSNSPPAERFYKQGEGPPGWRIENGRYVRVRVPEEREAPGATERVQKPGVVDVETPYGNAPLPPAGAPGEVVESQPLPLEYRDVLTRGGGP